MKPLLERLPTGGRVAVIRLRSLGDCVLTTPALQILKDARPDLEIAVVVEPKFAPVFEHHPSVDRILPPSAVGLARWRPDLAINFHGAPRSVLLTVASRARYRAGFAHHRGSWIYNIRVPRAQEVLGLERKVHTAEHLASAMFHLGVPRREIPRASLFARPCQHPRPYAILHPFASSADKAWPGDRFAATARAIRDSGELEPVILCGPGDDAAAFAGFELLRNAPLATVKSAIRSASLFIGNDSGPAHMAAAFGIPSVVLFGPSDPLIWAPWKPVAAEALVRPAIADISVVEVLRAIEHVKAPA